MVPLWHLSLCRQTDERMVLVAGERGGRARVWTGLR